MSSFRGFGTMQFSQGFRGMSRSFTARSRAAWSIRWTLRTVVVLAMAWVMVFLTDAQGGIGSISRRSWLFLILSGLATGASWLCYFRALQMAEVSKVMPVDKLSVVITLLMAVVFLQEKLTARSLTGALLITVGTVLMALSAKAREWKYRDLPAKNGIIG